MKTPTNDCPAAHSMDTDWFAVDERGNVAVFATGEAGALPGRALSDPEGHVSTALAAQLVLGRLGQVKWRTQPPSDAFEVALVAAKGKLKTRALREVAAGALTLYAPKDELEDDELDALFEDPALHGYLLGDELGAAAGLATYRNDCDGAPGDYVRTAPPSKQSKLPAALAKKVKRLTLPVDFTKAKRLELWRYVPESDVSMWEDDVPYDGGVSEAREQAAQVRRYEYEQGSSSKFWEVQVEGTTLRVRFGRLGTDGQSQEKRFESAEAAVAGADALVRSKVAKGYLPATAGAPAQPVEGWQPCALTASSFADCFGVLPPAQLRVLMRESPDVREAAIDFGSGTPGYEAREQFIERWSLAPWMGIQPDLPEALQAEQLGLPGADEQASYVGLRPAAKGSVRYASTASGSRAWLRVAVITGKAVAALRRETVKAERDAAVRRRELAERGDVERLGKACEKGDIAALKAAPRQLVAKHAGDLVWRASTNGRVNWKVVDVLLPLARKAVQDAMTALLETADLEQAKQALERGADVKRSLVLAHQLTNPKVFRLLHQHGMPVNRRVDGATVLHAQKSPEIIAWVGKAGVDPNAKSFGKTALAAAVSFLDETTVGRVKALLATGADPRAKYDGKPLKQHIAEHVAGRTNNKSEAARIAAKVVALLDAAEKA